MVSRVRASILLKVLFVLFSVLLLTPTLVLAANDTPNNAVSLSVSNPSVSDTLVGSTGGAYRFYQFSYQGGNAPVLVTLNYQPAHGGGNHIADAKDADMAWGVAAPGKHGRSTDARSTGTFRTRSNYLDDMRALVAEGIIDILLTSASNGERLAVQGLVGDEVTLAVRANDTTDIWNPRGGNYPASPSRPFRTVRLEAIKPFCDLVLYSVTFNNDVALDTATLNSYRDFRAESADLGVRYFLEVFNPNAPQALNGSDIGCFVNDSIVRALAGVTSSERPLFLKMAYNGQVALRELVEHDPSIVVGILGGSAGTTRDTFELLQRAEAAGARVALFGRKIQRAESQLDLVRLMRPVLRGDLTPAEAVQVYHEALAAARIEPIRSLKDDIDVTDPLLRGE